MDFKNIAYVILGGILFAQAVISLHGEFPLRKNSKKIFFIVFYLCQMMLSVMICAIPFYDRYHIFPNWLILNYFRIFFLLCTVFGIGMVYYFFKTFIETEKSERKTVIKELLLYYLLGFFLASFQKMTFIWDPFNLILALLFVMVIFFFKHKKDGAVKHFRQP